MSNLFRKYRYLQYTQGVETQTNEFLEKDDNLIELKIFKVKKNDSAHKIDTLLEEMQDLFKYGNNKLKYLQTEFGDSEYLSLVLMSTKLKSSLSTVFFSKDPEERRTLNSSILLYKIACELDKLHKENIIHGCIKPENIYLDSKNNPQVVNYGLRQIMDNNENLVNYGQVVDSYSSPDFLSYMKLKGTVYEPPEMRKIKKCTNSSEIEVYNTEIDDKIFDKVNINKNYYTAKMDVYAYGILFYEIMSRERLKIDKISIRNESIFPGDRHFPDAIRDLIKQCLSINPSNRPSFPAIISAMKKICDDNQYNLTEAYDEAIEDNNMFEIPFNDPPNDIKKIFTKASQGDVESCLIAFHILDNYDAKLDNYGINFEKGMIRMNIGIQHLFHEDSNNKGDEMSGKIEIEKYNKINELVYPKTVLVPLVSYEISSLTMMKNNSKASIEKCYQYLKDVALSSTDPNLYLYLACVNKTEKLLLRSHSISRSSTLSRTSSRSSIFQLPSSFSISMSTSFSNYNNSASTLENQLNESCFLLEEAAKYGSSDALILLGCIKLYKNDPDKTDIVPYYFKVAADMYNPYGMVNFGIILQQLGNEKNNELLYTLAGKYYKMASQSQLRIDQTFIGLYLYNKEIEEGLVDDEASRIYDIEKKRWVDWFLTMPSGRLFVHATEDFISKSDTNSSNFQSSHQTVQKTYEEMAKKGKTKKEVQEIDLNVAQEYGRDIHTSYSTTAEFIKDILDKYQNTTDFPRCPRVLCYGQTCFPVGPLFTADDKVKVQKLNENMCVHFYCPRCNDFYLPSQVLYKNIPSIYFPRNYLPKALKKLYKIENFPENKPFVQFIPTIFGMPMMEAKTKSKKTPPKDDASDAAGFFVIKDSKKKSGFDE